MKIFKLIGVLVCGLWVSGGGRADSGFGASTGQYNPYAGYSVGGQAAFVGENIGLEAGVVGLNALAQKAYKWGNSFSQGKSSRSSNSQFEDFLG